METIFKEGMKVYDSIYFPKKEGIVESIRKDNVSGKYIISVLFNGSSEYQYYDLEGCLVDSFMCTLASYPYEHRSIGFKQRPS